jgi:hypothetical protein
MPSARRLPRSIRPVWLLRGGCGRSRSCSCPIRCQAGACCWAPLRCKAQLDALKRSNPGARAVVSMSVSALVTPGLEQQGWYKDLERSLASWYTRGEGRLGSRAASRGEQRTGGGAARPEAWN